MAVFVTSQRSLGTNGVVDLDKPKHEILTHHVESFMYKPIKKEITTDCEANTVMQQTC